jgi:class 3 adenylate cyclase/pimeloyl-ACP methyl ester carboxylesterase
MEPQIQYCRTSDGVTIAYAVSGTGTQLLVHTSNDLTATLQYETQGHREWREALGQRFTVVRYDSRGTGLSDRDCKDLSIAALARDLSAVVEATAHEPFVLYAHLGGMFAAASYAAQRPHRLQQMVLWPPPLSDLADARNSTLGRLAIADWETFTETYAHIALGWARGNVAHEFARGMRATVTQGTWLRFMRQFIEPGRNALEETFADLKEIAVPTLVIQRRSYQDFPRIAGLIPSARTKMVEGEGVGPHSEPSQVRAIVDAIAEFTGAKEAAGEVHISTPTIEASALGTIVILFADIVDSTALTERMGDAAFRDRARALDVSLRSIITDAGGAAIDGKLLGDGVLATFPAASQAIDAALRCGIAGNDGGLPLHLGLHAGDVIREANNVFGGAVNIAARISALSAPGEVLVSRTVADLARTSARVTFEDRGEHALKGVADQQWVFAVRRR